MHRAQLILEDWQYERLRSLSASKGKSISELVRDILAEHLQASGAAGRRPLASIKGIGRNAGFTAREHDDVLYGRKGRR